MDKFSQEFKDNLESQSLPRFDASDWDDMQSRLDATQDAPKSYFNKFGWLVAAGLLLLTGSNLFLLKELQKTNNTVKQLLTNQDTIVKTSVVYQTDTIYINNSSVAFNSNSNSKKQNTTASIYSKTTTSYKSTTNNQEGNKWLKDYSSNSPLNNSIFNKEVDELKFRTNPQIYLYSNPSIINHEAQSDPTTRNNALSLLPSIPLGLLNNPTYSFPSVVSTAYVSAKKNKKLGQYLYPMMPKGLEVGSFIGTSIFAPSNYDDLHTRQPGVAINIVFSDAWRIWSSASQTRLTYESKQMGEEYGIPEIPIPSDEWKIEEIYVTRKIWSADIGLQYNFRTNKKLQPFLGAGYGTSSMTLNDLRYKFENRMTDESYYEDRSFTKEQQLEFAIIRSGLNYRLNKWSLGLEGVYLHRVSNTNAQIPSDFSARFSVFYRL